MRWEDNHTAGESFRGFVQSCEKAEKGCCLVVQACLLLFSRHAVLLVSGSPCPLYTPSWNKHNTLKILKSCGFFAHQSDMLHKETTQRDNRKDYSTRWQARMTCNQPQTSNWTSWKPVVTPLVVNSQLSQVCANIYIYKISCHSSCLWLCYASYKQLAQHR